MYNLLYDWAKRKLGKRVFPFGAGFCEKCEEDRLAVNDLF